MPTTRDLPLEKCDDVLFCKLTIPDVHVAGHAAVDRCDCLKSGEVSEDIRHDHLGNRGAAACCSVAIA